MLFGAFHPKAEDERSVFAFVRSDSRAADKYRVLFRSGIRKKLSRYGGAFPGRELLCRRVRGDRLLLSDLDRPVRPCWPQGRRAADTRAEEGLRQDAAAICGSRGRWRIPVFRRNL